MNLLRTSSDSKGFTLIEALVAIVIFSIGIVALSKMHLSATLGNRNAFELTDATMGAASELEAVLAKDYSSLNGTRTITYDTFTVTYSVAQSSNSSDLKTVSLTVHRHNLPGITNRYKLIVADLGS